MMRKARFRDYIIVSLVFSAVFITALLAHRLAMMFGMDRMMAGLVLRCMMFLGFGATMVLMIKDGQRSVKWGIINNKHWLLLLFLVGLFAANNIFSLLVYGNNYFKLEISASLWIYILAIMVNSVAEEITYRGFVQGYINRHVPEHNSLLSRGNLYATFLMLVTHLGFFTVMAPTEAVMALMLVLVFSLTAGYMRDATGGILFPILTHIVCNYTHILVNYCSL